MILLFDVGGVLAQNLDAVALATQLVEVLTKGLKAYPVRACFYLWNEFSGAYEPVARRGAWPEGTLASGPTLTPFSIGWGMRSFPGLALGFPI